MGYRHNIGILSKDKHDSIKDMNYEQLKQQFNDEYVPAYRLTNEVYELGKYYDANFLAPFRSDVFNDLITNDLFNTDREFFLLSKEGLEAIIDDYRKKVLTYYESLLNPSEFGSTPELAIKAKIRTWGEDCTKWKVFPYSLHGERITTSWDYEYAIFELVRIYKSIDWDTQLVTITAW